MNKSDYWKIGKHWKKMSESNAFNDAKVATKLTLISEVMGDGYHFLTLRFLVEDWERLANEGDEVAIRAMQMIEQFHKLCLATKNIKQ